MAKGEGGRNYIPSGKAIESLACPLCMWVRPLNYGKDKDGSPRQVGFNKMRDLPHYPVWRKEKLLGRGVGKAVLETKTLKELPEEMKGELRRGCRAILAELEEGG